jgi:CheY-like chemotaxis protein
VVRLEGHCEGSRAILRVIDDGAGVDMEAVWRKAVRLGLWSPHEPLPKEALVDLLAQPGFSTRDEADTLAGRGIGLDVVAAAVRDLDGQLSIATEPGAGTVFTIEVPVTASTGLGLLVRVGEHAFGILLNHVERAIRVGREDVRVLESHDTVMIGDAPVAVLPLGCLVGLPESRLPEQKAPALVLRSGKQRLVVTVDDVPGDQALVVKPLGRAFAGASHLGGAAVQPDGTVLPVLSVPALFTIAAGVARPSQAEGPSVAAPRASEAMSVLVADDSLAMRTLLRNILRADGYDVSVAHDGREALGVLASMPRCDLVVTDLQMPHMDGVELCRAVRQSARPHVPVVLVTSVGDAGEKQRALAAGADAYVIKSEFEQARFLSLCARLSGR